MARSRRDRGQEGRRLYELAISLLDAGVDIERRVLVPVNYTLADLHAVIQAAMGWADYHLHEFTAHDGTRYGHPDDEGPMDGPELVDETRVPLGTVLREPGDALLYMYDFGDDWRHRVELTAVRPPDGPPRPSVIGGRGACPPEDCGGVWGYEELRELLADPDADGYEEMAEWTAGMLGRPVESPIDVHAFDLEAANEAVRRRLRGAGRRRRP